MYTQRNSVNTTNYVGSPSWTSFASDRYWSSTECSGYPTDGAWGQIFGNGIQDCNVKDLGYRVRCVRTAPPPVVPEICGSLNQSNAVYVMTQNVNSTGTCFTIAANNVTLDCNGHTINYSQSAWGAGVRITGNSSTVKNCNIIQRQPGITAGSAIDVSQGSKNNIFTSNNISTVADYAYGIYLEANGGNNNTFTSNNISTTGTFAYGLTILSRFNNITSNEISTAGSGARGFILSNSNNTVTSNSVSTANTNAHGFQLNSNDNIINNNTVTATGSGAYGFFVSWASNNIIMSNNISATGSGAYGFSFESCSNNRISNNRVNATSAVSVTYDWMMPSSTIQSWNTTLAPGTNIIGGSNFGGNFWANPSGTGFSQNCTANGTVNSSGVCTSQYLLETSSYGNNTDYLPLASLPPPADCSTIGPFSTPNTVYTLMSDVYSDGGCFGISANNVTLDCQGHTINFSQTFSSSGISTWYNHTTIRNCNIVQGSGSVFAIGISLSSSSNSTIIGNNITVNGIDTNSFAIQSNSGLHNNVTGNRITVLNQGSRGIDIGQSTNYSSFTDNVIDSSGYGSSAIGSGMDSNNNTIANNVVSTNGTYADGISVNGMGVAVVGNSIINNTVVTAGNSSSGISIHSDNYSTISGNTVTVTGGSSTGISISGIADTVSNNIITGVAPASNYRITGINTGGSDITFVNNTISLTGDNSGSGNFSFGINMYGSVSGNQMISNNVTTNGNNAIGLQSNGPSGTRFENNTVVTYKLSSPGIAMYNGNGLVATGNTITTYGNSSNGINVQGLSTGTNANNSVVSGNTIGLFGSGTPGVSGLSGIFVGARTNNATVSSNNITLSGAFTSTITTQRPSGITVIGLLNNIVANNIVIINETALRNRGIVVAISGADSRPVGTVVANNTVISAANESRCIFLSSLAGSTFVSGNEITMTSSANYSYGLYLSLANNSAFSDNTILASADAIGSSYIYVDSVSVNNSMNDTAFAASDGRVRFPFIQLPDSTVVNISTRALNISFNSIYLNTTNAAVNVTLNRSAELTLLGLNATNHIPTYRLADSGAFSDCPGTICTVLNPGANSTFVYNVTGFTTYSSRELTANTAPSIILISPDIDSYLDSSTVTFTFNATDDTSATMNCSIYVNGTLRFTNSSVLNNTATTFTVSSLSNRLMAWYINCSDAAGNSNVSDARNVAVDTVNPVISSFTLSSNSVNVGDTITYSCNATDNSESYGGNVSTAVTGIDTTSAGSKIATCTATDTVGRTAVQTASYIVSTAIIPIYSSGGISCTPSWNCSEWTECSANGTITRACTDTKNCGTTRDKPVETASCVYLCLANWQCGGWTACSIDGFQSRACSDLNNCQGPASSQPISRGCVYIPQDIISEDATDRGITTGIINNVNSALQAIQENDFRAAETLFATAMSDVNMLITTPTENNSKVAGLVLNKALDASSELISMGQTSSAVNILSNVSSSAGMLASADSSLANSIAQKVFRSSAALIDRGNLDGSSIILNSLVGTTRKILAQGFALTDALELSRMDPDSILRLPELGVSVSGMASADSMLDEAGRFILDAGAAQSDESKLALLRNASGILEQSFKDVPEITRTRYESKDDVTNIDLLNQLASSVSADSASELQPLSEHIQTGALGVEKEMSVYSVGNAESTGEVFNITLVKLRFNSPMQLDNLTVVEYIPKGVAGSASDMIFSIQPTIIEDDPLVSWTFGRMLIGESKTITYVIKGKVDSLSTLTVAVGEAQIAPVITTPEYVEPVYPERTEQLRIAVAAVFSILVIMAFLFGKGIIKPPFAKKEGPEQGEVPGNLPKIMTKQEKS